MEENDQIIISSGEVLNLKLECLHAAMALSAEGDTADKVLYSAERFLDWLTGVDKPKH